MRPERKQKKTRPKIQTSRVGGATSAPWAPTNQLRGWEARGDLPQGLTMVSIRTERLFHVFTEHFPRA